VIKRTFSSIVMIAGALVLFRYMPTDYANIIFYIFSCIAIFELADMVGEPYFQKLFYCVLWMPVFFFLDSIRHVIAYLYFVFFIGIWKLILNDKIEMDRFLIVPFYILLSCVPFYFMSQLFSEEKLMLFSVLVMVWVYDIVAYLAGKNMGKHKITRNISPKKSWEGLIIASVVVVTVAYLVGMNSSLFDSVDMLHRAFLVIILAPAGDLALSMLKRGFKIKDTGNIIPGHGGILDRLDSLIFLVPAIYILGVV